MTVTATPAKAAEDHAHLARALTAARAARGRTSPNPAVGCVIVRDGVVVGTGMTAPAGGPHAEVFALRQAGRRADGASVYVTLEPCTHHGRTAPCADALIDAGVARVVIAHLDPHAVAAGGVARLRAAGVEVEVVDGLLRSAVADELEGFLMAVTRGRPHVTLKLAQTVDGHLTGAERWITGPAARRAVHRWRGAVDGVLVGSGTVLADDPGLDVREVPLGDRPQPRPIVLDARLRTPPTARVVARGALVVTSPAASAAARAALQNAGATIVEAPAAAGGGLDLDAGLRAVAAAGVNAVLAEPGRTLAHALMAADLVDRLVLHIALARGDGRPAVAVPVAGRWHTTRLGGAGTDLVWERVRDRAVDRAVA